MAEKKGDRSIEVSRPSSVEKKTKNKWIMVAGGAVVLILFAVIGSQPDKTQLVQQRAAPAQNITLGDFKEADWVARAQAEVRDANAKAANIQAESQGIKSNIEQQNNSMREMQQTMQAMRKQMEDMQAERIATAKQIDDLSKRPAAAPAPRPIQEGEDGFVPPPLPQDGQFNDAMQNAQGGPTQRAQRRELEAIVIEGETIDPEAQPSKISYKKNPYAGFLPAGSFAEGALLYGLDAGASEFTRTNPQPVMIRISENAFTPGDSRYKLAACAAIGEAYGDLSSERAYIRVNRISCLDPKNKVVLETTVTAVVVDSDGSLGLRGEVIRRNGQIIAKGVIAGIADGIASIGKTASQAAAQRITAPVSGGTQTTSTDIDPALLGQAGAFGGASNAASQIAELYLKEAASIFPVVAVPPGRKLTVSFTKGTQMTWERFEGAFTKEIIPEQK